VALDANFSKSGYSAHLRTKDIDSSSPSIAEGQGSHQLSKNWRDSRHSEQRLKFWKRPIVRQYFHKGLLWRLKESVKVSLPSNFSLISSVLELLVSLVIQLPSEDEIALSLLHFTIAYLMSWRM
jgi:hypothetical protein